LLNLSESYCETLVLTNQVHCDLALSESVSSSQQLFEALEFVLPQLWQEIMSHIANLVSLPQAGQEVSFGVLLVTNPEIQALNRQFRNKDEATDVLTFSMTEAHSYQTGLPEIQLGEIYLSLDWAKDMVDLKTDRVFNEHGNFADPIVLFLIDRLIHGILHLLGVHHNTDSDYNRVIHIQNQVLHVLTQSPS